MWKNIVEPDRPQMALQHGACVNATTTHLVYEVFVALSRQQWSRERALWLRYITLPVFFSVKYGGVLYSNYEAL